MAPSSQGNGGLDATGLAPAGAGNDLLVQHAEQAAHQAVGGVAVAHVLVGPLVQFPPKRKPADDVLVDGEGSVHKRG